MPEITQEEKVRDLVKNNYVDELISQFNLEGNPFESSYRREIQEVKTELADIQYF